MELSLLLLEHLAESAIGVRHEGLRGIILKHASFSHHQHHVAPYYCVESMSDAYDCGILKLFVYKSLDGLLRYHVDICRGFI